MDPFEGPPRDPLKEPKEQQGGCKLSEAEEGADGSEAGSYFENGFKMGSFKYRGF